MRDAIDKLNDVLIYLAQDWFKDIKPGVWRLILLPIFVITMLLFGVPRALLGLIDIVMYYEDYFD